MRVYMFPGQGAQNRGMGADLFDQMSEFNDIEQEIDDLLGYSIRTLCLEDPDGKLRQTQYTQVALYTVNGMSYFQKRKSGVVPDFLVGHSLGEYNALLAAGAFDFLTGLRLVRKRGELMAQAKHGAMAAVIGLPPARIADALRDSEIFTLDIANFNSPSQSVLSGPVDDIQKAGTVFKAATYIPLRVSAAFHSRYMRRAAEEFEDFISSFEFAAPRIPVISNVTSSPYPSEGDVSVLVRSLLVRQITSPVQWTSCIQSLIRKGASEFDEIGPGKTLTHLLKEIRSENLPLQTVQ